MSRESNQVMELIREYVRTMRSGGREPAAISVSIQQYQQLKSAHITENAGRVNSIPFNPEYDGIPIVPYHGDGG